jgi:hypothetical protein
MVMEADDLLRHLPMRFFAEAIVAHTPVADYVHYRTACRHMGETPIPRWKFHIAYSIYQRHFYQAVDFDPLTGSVTLRRDYQPNIPWATLRAIAKKVDFGREYAVSNPSSAAPEDDGAAGGMGVREPRRPIHPVLAASAGRPFPPTQD